MLKQVLRGESARPRFHWAAPNTATIRLAIHQRRIFPIHRRAGEGAGAYSSGVGVGFGAGSGMGRRVYTGGGWAAREFIRSIAAAPHV